MDMSIAKPTESKAPNLQETLRGASGIACIRVGRRLYTAVNKPRLDTSQWLHDNNEKIKWS